MGKGGWRNTCQVIHKGGKEKPTDLLIRRRGVRSNPECQNNLPVVKAGSVKPCARKHGAELCTLHDLHVCITWSVSQNMKMAILHRKKKIITIHFLQTSLLLFHPCLQLLPS